MIEMTYHPLANLFPLMEGQDFADLVADIKANGLHEPVITHEGQILDGRNRYRACVKAGVAPRFVAYKGDDALRFVVSLNLRRRHMTESQRAMVAAKLANMPHGGDRKTDQTANLQFDPVSAPAVSVSVAAEMLNVSERSVANARAVIENAVPELADKVAAGEVSVSAAADVAQLPRDEQREVLSKGDKSLILGAAKKVRAERETTRRTERIEKIAEIAKGNAPLAVAAKFPVIYADPPWRYEHAISGSREIENHYPTMSLDEICAMPVQDIVTDDAILYMWATAPKLAECMKVLTAWGFDYRTNFVWVKDKIGMGYHARSQHEILLVAKRGNIPPPAVADRVSSVVMAERGEHSAKPEVFYELIESFYPTLPKIELFCRSPRDGWAVWGNQSERAA
jgi:N6-adenosine-specific RNA methylase IME4/ParB-like chromosome segregation protein Spo0J